MKNKNKNLMLLLGVGIAYYLFYKMYAKKSIVDNIQKNPIAPTLLNDLAPNIPDINVSQVPSQFLVDNVKTAELVYEPNTYQTFYGSTMAGNGYKVPSTC